MTVLFQRWTYSAGESKILFRIDNFSPSQLSKKSICTVPTTYRIKLAFEIKFFLTKIAYSPLSPSFHINFPFFSFSFSIYPIPITLLSYYVMCWWPSPWPFWSFDERKVVFYHLFPLFPLNFQNISGSPWDNNTLKFPIHIKILSYCSQQFVKQLKHLAHRNSISPLFH